MNKQNSHILEGGPEPLDDSWWAAVLAEEESRQSATSVRVSASTPPADNKTGQVRLAVKQAPMDWERAQEIYERDELLCLKVVGHNRGGLLVEGEDLQGFVPVSHLVDLSVENTDPNQSPAELAEVLNPYLGRVLRLKVIECDPERGRIVLSERAALSEPGRRNYLMDSLCHGDCVHGVVTNVTDFGVFVDLGGVEGLIHVSELSWGRVRHPSDVAAIGQDLEAYVINVDKDRSRVGLSLKRLHPNPWDTAEARYRPGQMIEAVITSIVPFGAFARLEEGLDGLIHVSAMSTNGEKIDPRKMLIEGQHVKVRVIQVEAQRQRLGLSLCPDDEV